MHTIWHKKHSRICSSAKHIAYAENACRDVNTIIDTMKIDQRRIPRQLTEMLDIGPIVLINKHIKERSTDSHFPEEYCVLGLVTVPQKLLHFIPTFRSNMSPPSSG
jgi:hypothetical protein